MSIPRDDGMPDLLRQLIAVLTDEDNPCIGEAQRCFIKAFDRMGDVKKLGLALSADVQAPAARAILGEIETKFMEAAALMRKAVEAVERDGYFIKPEELHGHRQRKEL